MWEKPHIWNIKVSFLIRTYSSVCLSVHSIFLQCLKALTKTEDSVTEDFSVRNRLFKISCWTLKLATRKENGVSKVPSSLTTQGHELTWLGKYRNPYLLAQYFLCREMLSRRFPCNLFWIILQSWSLFSAPLGFRCVYA